MKYLFVITIIASAAFIMRKPKEPTEPNDIKTERIEKSNNTRS